MPIQKYLMTKKRLLGFCLILLSWIFWGMIIVIPFLKLGGKTTTIAITVLLIASNIFWVGAILVGKELIEKLRIWTFIRTWIEKE